MTRNGAQLWHLTSMNLLIIPPLHRNWNRGILDSPRCLSVRLSVRPSVDKVSGTLKKKNIGSIRFIPGIYPYGVSLLTPMHFRVPSLIFGPLVAKYLAENGVSETFWKNYWLNSLHTWLAFIFMGWISWPLYIFVFLASFLSLWWPNIWPKMWFPKLFEKTIGSIHFFFLKNSHLCSTRLQNRNLYWIFLDEVDSDQSRGILSPFMGTARFFWCSLGLIISKVKTWRHSGCNHRLCSVFYSRVFLYKLCFSCCLLQWYKKYEYQSKNQ